MAQTLVAVSPEELARLVREAVRDEIQQSPPRPNKNWLTSAEIAKHFGVTVGTIQNWCTREDCPHYDVGGIRRFELGPVDRWFRQRQERKLERVR